MKKLLLLCSCLIILYFVTDSIPSKSEEKTNKIEQKTAEITQREETESAEERARFTEERLLYEYYRQMNPLTGEIPRTAKALEFSRAKQAKLKINSSARAIQTSYVSRGPSNLGGRTRALVVDVTDNTGNTIIAGGVSSGVFRTTDGGASWTKVSPNDEIHNVTTIVQDPRSGHQDTWYYGTGEAIGNSASLTASYFGQGIWKSTDSGMTWTQMSITSSDQTSYDSDFDFIFKLAIHPITGDLYAAVGGKIIRIYDDGVSMTDEITNGSISSSKHTDVVITSSGRVYAGFSGTNDTDTKGVWTKDPDMGIWSRISHDAMDNPIFTPAGRVVLALAPSNEDKLYVLFGNGSVSDCDTTPAIEADLWMWNQSNTTFTDYSSKLPDETGCSDGNDPFAIQGGYDMVVSVKPDNDNFVVIGGTNAYKKTDITATGTFVRIGGYKSANGYAIYGSGDFDLGDMHHPDIHAMVFNPFDTSVLFTGTDGGVHKTDNVAAGIVSWTNLNNNYQTLQYYHVNIDPMSGSDIVIGGAQDNGTTVGGTDWSEPDSTTQTYYVGGDGGSVAISRDDMCLPFFVSIQNGVLYRDCPDPDPTEITPEVMPGTPYDSQFVTLFHLDPDNNKTLYYAAKGTLLRTTDATHVTSNTWDDLGSTTVAFGDEDKFQVFSTSWGTYNASTSYLLMGGDKGHIYRLDDPQNMTRDLSDAVDITPAGATVISISEPNKYSVVTGLAIDPTDNDIVLATYSNYGTESIFLTTNATDPSPTWTLVERNLSEHSIRSAAIVEDSGETTYFVGTARGLYSSPDPTTTDWVREAPNQIGYALVSDLKYRPADHKLLIGTHGNGMYEATISATLGTDDFHNVSSVIKLYPNPVQNSLNVKLLQADGVQMSYNIISLSGQTVSKGVLNGETINVSQLTTGMYFLQVKTNDGRKGAKSFIKR